MKHALVLKITAITAILLAAILPGPAHGDELFPHGHFEDDMLAPGPPMGWELGDGAFENLAVVEAPHPVNSESTKCLEVRSGAGLVKALTGPIPIDRNLPLHITAWVRGSDPSDGAGVIRLRLEWLDAGGNIVKWDADRPGRASIYIGSSTTPKWVKLEKNILRVFPGLTPPWSVRWSPAEPWFFMATYCTNRRQTIPRGTVGLWCSTSMNARTRSSGSISRPI